MVNEEENQDRKISFAADLIKREGDLEFGFKCGRLLSDLGGIQCTCMTWVSEDSQK